MRSQDQTALALAFLIAIRTPVAVGATPPPADERFRSLQLAARSELGILEYCRAQGLVDDAAVIVQRQMIERLAIGAKASVVGLSEEEAGRAGFLAFHGPHGRFGESAHAQGLTLKTACENRAAVAKATTSPQPGKL